MLSDTSAGWKQCDLQHARTSIDKTLEVRFLGKVSCDLRMCSIGVVYM